MKDNIKKGFVNIQLFADEPTGATTPETTQTQGQPNVDYEKELNTLRGEIEKYKKLKDDYAKESAGYKKQLADKMTDDEKNAQAQQEFEKRMANLEAENRQMKLEKELFAEGFSVEESAKLIESNFAVKTIAEIIKAKVEVAVKSAKAESLKETTTNAPMGNGTAKGNDKTGFQKYQETRQKTINRVEL
jgi:hypothetical protein